MPVRPAVGELSGWEDSNFYLQRDREATLIDVYVWIENEARGERIVATAFVDVNNVLLGQVFAVWIWIDWVA